MCQLYHLSKCNLDVKNIFLDNYLLECIINILPMKQKNWYVIFHMQRGRNFCYSVNELFVLFHLSQTVVLRVNEMCLMDNKYQCHDLVTGVVCLIYIYSPVIFMIQILCSSLLQYVLVLQLDLVIVMNISRYLEPQTSPKVFVFSLCKNQLRECLI